MWLGLTDRATLIGSELERRLECAADRLQNLDPLKQLVLGLDQGPGNEICAGTLDHLSRRGLIVVPVSAVAPVLWCDLEVLVAQILALAEALQLLLLADLEPEFHD